MQCVIPEETGFCYGVRLAVAAAREHQPCFLYGEIVNNPVIMGDLTAGGCKILHSPDELPEKCENPVVIRAHGVPKAVTDALSARGARLIDKTCPHVKKIHRIMEETDGDFIIIGKERHPEVRGIFGRGQGRKLIVGNLGEARALLPEKAAAGFGSRGAVLVAQTTFERETFGEIAAFAQKILPRLRVFETICDATALRRRKVAELAAKADFCVIVGGPESSNTRKLYETAKARAKSALISRAEELDTDALKNAETVLIAGGTSTPAESVLETAEALRAYCERTGQEFTLTD
ncbi:MAG: 4-hydroxy-3-methylbut-2-enyl diphosphate reductase [Clostridiales bacterium]|jgi:4-hydroxy-3-methylbut-2-enyl diphosphate reductase|nr:4-hydroxy-3-methylbut-2-enyl diphosphate reductase [Clostridiales bacterium]